MKLQLLTLLFFIPSLKAMDSITLDLSAQENPDRSMLIKSMTTLSVSEDAYLIINEEVSDMHALIQQQDIHGTTRRGNTLLHFAACLGKDSCCQQLIEADANLNTLNNIQKTSILLHNKTPLVMAAENGHFTTACILLDNGAPIKPASRHDYSAIEAAILCRHYKLAEELIRRAAKTNANWLRDNLTTLFFHAAKELMMGNRLERAPNADLERAANADLEHFIEVLIDADLDINAVEYFTKFTPLHGMAEANHVGFCQRLLEKGANVNAAQYSRNKDKSMFTPLHAAAEQGVLEACELLLKNGANVNALAKGKAPLQIAVEHNQKFLTEFGFNVEFIKRVQVRSRTLCNLLLENGAEPISSLCLAAEHNNQALCETLAKQCLFFPSKAEVDTCRKCIVTIILTLKEVAPYLPKDLILQHILLDRALQRQTAVVASSYMKAGLLVPPLFKRCLQEEVLSITMGRLTPVLVEAIAITQDDEIKCLLNPQMVETMVTDTIEQRFIEPRPCFAWQSEEQTPTEINQAYDNYIVALLCTVVALYIAKKVLMDTPKAQKEASHANTFHDTQNEELETLS